MLLDGRPGHDDVLAAVDTEADQGHRVVLLADADALDDERLPETLAPVAIVVLGDIPRPDAADTLRYFAEQHVTVKVISGDDPRTVGAIAARLGLDGSRGTARRANAAR